MFFFPLRDDNETLQTPHITWVILLSCVVAFIWQMSLGREEQLVIFAYGMIPARLFGLSDFPSEIANVPAWTTLVSSMFLHGGFMHLAGNMLYLWIFADNVEDSCGRAKFVALYLFSGIAAALSQAAIDPQSVTPMIGASGAIAGTLGAYLMLHPQANVRCLIGIFIFFRMINIPAFIVLGGWIALQFLNLGQTESNVAYVAHIGGFVAGMALIPFMRRPGVALFAAGRSRAFELSTMRRHVPQIPPLSQRPRANPWDK